MRGSAGGDLRHCRFRGEAGLSALLGVDHVLDSRSLAFADEILEITGGSGVDVVLNFLSGEAVSKNLTVLKPFGRSWSSASETTTKMPRSDCAPSATTSPISGSTPTS